MDRDPNRDHDADLEPELLRRALRGDRGAVERIVEDHLRLAWAVAYSLTGSRSSAEDLVQDAFLDALRSLPRFREGERFAPWLLTILRRRHVDRRRRVERERRAIEARESERRGGGEESPRDAMERAERDQVLRCVVEDLPEDLRLPLVLHHLEGLPTERVADILGLRPPAVRKRLERARGRLRAGLLAKLSVAAFALEPPEGLRDRVVESTLGALGPGAMRDAGAPTSDPPGHDGHRLARPRAQQAISAAAAAAGILLAAAILAARWLVPARIGGDADPVARLADSKDDAPRSREGAEPLVPRGDAPAPPASGSGVSVRGRVVHEATRDPLPGARVLFFDDPHTGTGAPVGSAETGQQGDFEFVGPVSEHVAVLVWGIRHEGFATRGAWYPRLDAREGADLGEIRLAPGVEVSGRVRLPDGSPARSGHVYGFSKVSESAAGHSGNEQYLPAEIDASGRFRIWLEGSRGALIVKVPGCLPAPVGPIVLAGTPPEPLEIRLAAGLALEGTVTDDAGAPAGGARVVAFSLPDGAAAFEGLLGRFHGILTASAGWETETDASGRFRLAGVPEWTTLSVSHPDLDGGPQVDVFAGGGPVRIVLGRACRIAMRVLDPDGRPLDRPVVDLECGSSSWALLRRNGDEFRSEPLGDASDGMLVVPGYAPEALKWPSSPGTHDVGTVSLHRGRDLDVRVVDPQGSPVASATVDLSLGGGEAWTPLPRHPWTRDRSLSDSSGVWTSSGIPAGPVRVSVSAEGFLPGEAILEADGGPQVEVGLRRGTVVVGTVVGPDERTIDRVVVAVRDPTGGRPRMLPWLPEGRWVRARVRQDGGAFRVEGLPPGTRLLLIVGAAGLLHEIIEVEAPAEGAELDLGTVSLRRGGVVRGRIVDVRGEPVAWAAIRASVIHGGSRVFTSSLETEGGPDGIFELAALHPGTYLVGAATIGLAARGEVPVELRGDEIQEIEVVLEPRAVYRGRVVHDDGSPVARATVILTVEGPAGARDVSEGTADNGRFRFVGVPAGVPVRVLVQYGRMGYGATAPPEAASAASVDLLPGILRVPRGADLEVAVDSPRRAPEGVRVVVAPDGGREWSETEHVSRLPFRLTDLPEGNAMVRVEADGFRDVEAQAVRLARGESARLRFVLEPTAEGRLTVRVATRSGDPVAGAAVFAGRGVHETRRVGETDERGEATVDWLGDPPQRIDVFREGLAPSVVDLGEPPLSGSTVPVVLDLEASIRLRVLDERGRVPGHGRAYLASRAGPPGDPGVGDLDPDGTVRIGSLAAGRHVIALDDGDEDEWGDVEVVLRAGEEREVTFRIPPGFEVTGTVRRQGQPVDGGEVLFFPGPRRGVRRAAVAAGGRYRILLRWRGEYEVGCEGHDASGEYRSRRTVELSGPTELDLEVE